MIDKHALIGLGSDRFSIGVYIANRPPLVEYQQLQQMTWLTKGEIAAIGNQCGNGWRKVFNVYAKLLFALDKADYQFSNMAETWQAYRDNFLLQGNDSNALLFNAPVLKNQSTKDKVVHIIMGRTYAKSLVNAGLLVEPLTWLDEEFAINVKHRLIVCPYFDYRQLSNVKIERLAKLVKSVN